MSTTTKTSSSTTTTCYSTEEDVDHQLRRGPWTVEEDNLLIHHISSQGEGRWNSLAKHSGLRRTGKSCRLRWLNYLKPDVKRGNLTPQEQLLILELHSKLGNRWSKIAQYLPGRTDNEIKNYWRTRVQKQARHLKIDSNSTAFEEVIRCLWMPRLLQKINGPRPSLEPIHQHEISLPQEVHDQFSLNGSNSTLNLDHQLKNSSSESIDSCSDQSMNISSALEITEQPTSDDLFYGMGQSDYNTLMKGGYNFDTTGFDMETLNQTPCSAMAMGDFREPIDNDSHVAEGNWSIDDDMAYGLWNMDEFWQLKDSRT